MNGLSENQLSVMLKLQDGMNSKVHPDWRSQNYEWYRATWIECGELMDHVGYKWWKKQQTDWPQVQLEIVDIWHFGMSDIIARSDTLEQAAEKILGEISQLQTVGDKTDCPTLHAATEALASLSLQHRAFDVPAFVDLMRAAELDFDTLYTSYVGKNVLNFFRQDNGYNDGSYVKTWAGREDNEHLSEIVQTLNASASDFSEQLYQALDARYRTQAKA